MMFRFFSEIVKGIFSASPYMDSVYMEFIISRRPQAYLVFDKKKKANIAKLISKTLITCRV